MKQRPLFIWSKSAHLVTMVTDRCDRGMGSCGAVFHLPSLLFPPCSLPKGLTCCPTPIGSGASGGFWLGLANGGISRMVGGCESAVGNFILPPSAQGHGSVKWPLHVTLSPQVPVTVLPLTPPGPGVKTETLCQGHYSLWFPSTLPILYKLKKKKPPFK